MDMRSWEHGSPQVIDLRAKRSQLRHLQMLISTHRGALQQASSRDQKGALSFLIWDRVLLLVAVDGPSER